MLLQFKCSNHRSIKEKVTFTMIAGPDDTHEDLLMSYGKNRVARTAVIYGANGSGKSNFIDALDLMRRTVRSSAENQIDTLIDQEPHKLSKKGTPSEYDIQFVYNKIRYAYGFSIKDGLVHSEYLYYFPRNKQVKVFERTGMKILPGDKYKNGFDGLKKGILQPNKLVLSCAPNNTDVKEVKEAFRFFSNGMIVFATLPVFDAPLFDLPFLGGIDVSAKVLERNEHLKRDFIETLRRLDVPVKDIEIRQLINPENKAEPNKRKEFFQTFIMGPKYKVTMVYDKFKIDLVHEESKGVKRLFQIIAPILIALDSGRVIVFDELELSLHERVLIDVVKLFQKYKRGKGSQLIFSTHDTNLLNADLFRRDQIWFTELTEDRATDLYALIEIKNVRKYENLAKGYISGKYGGIPMCNESLFEDTDY